MSHCPSQAWRRGLDCWQGRAPSHMNCLICELLSLQEGWAGGDSTRGLGQCVFNGEGVGRLLHCVCWGREGGD